MVRNQEKQQFNEERIHKRRIDDRRGNGSAFAPNNGDNRRNMVGHGDLRDTCDLRGQGRAIALQGCLSHPTIE